VTKAILAICIGVAQAILPAGAQQPPTLPETTISAPRGETVGATAPLVELLPRELESYGADTLSDLVDALKPMTRSSRGDRQPVVLINGHLAGQIEFQNLPSEAVERVEVLPETVALQYGFSENQRVINIILRADFQAIPARSSDSGATEGGSQTQFADASMVRLGDEARGTLYASYKDAAWLRASDRGIDVPDASDLTLQPATTNTSVAGTLSGAILGVSSSLEASIDAQSIRTMQGVDDAGVGPLGASNHEITATLAAQLTGLWGHAVWGATATYVRAQTDSLSEIGFNSDGTAISDRTSSGLNTGSLQLSLSGPAVQLPAGPLAANLKVGFQYQGFDTSDGDLVRTVRTGSLNASIPLSASGGALKLGDIAATFNATMDNVSNVGPLWSVSYGLDWFPIKKVHFDAIVTDHDSAPTVQQVLAPPVFTPNVETFDFVTGETVYATEITGGGGKLQPMDDQVRSFGLALGPVLDRTVFSAHYEEHRVSNGIGTLPPLTADVEQAFPERFVREDGTLVELDDRAVNLQRERIDDLKWGFNLWAPLNSAPGSRGGSNRIEFSAFDTWYRRDTILIRTGIPQLDLLNGAPSDVSGGQPRHKLEFRSVVYHNGIGSVLSAAWRSPTLVASDDLTVPDTLYFSSLFTVDFRVFADFTRIPSTRNHAWSKGARMSIAVTNLFDRRQSVHDSFGATPVAFEPGYLDPPGRVIFVSLRKVF